MCENDRWEGQRLSVSVELDTVFTLEVLKCWAQLGADAGTGADSIMTRDPLSSMQAFGTVRGGSKLKTGEQKQS